MRNIGEIEVGRFFQCRDRRYMKMGQFQHNGQTFIAVDIATGSPAFPVPCEKGSDQAFLQSLAVQVEPMKKPDWVTFAAGSLRFDTKEKREETAAKLRKAFPYVELIQKDRPGAFFLNYTTTADIHRRIKTRFGG